MDFLKDINGKPILPLGLQTCNSSTGVPEMLEREIRALELFSGNTLEAPVYWFRVESEQGRFDFSDVDDLITRCRARGLFLILLWFGTSKNGHPNYAPEWVKLRPETYRLARGADGAHVASLSPYCQATLEADSREMREFNEWMQDQILILRRSGRGAARQDDFTPDPDFQWSDR